MENRPVPLLALVLGVSLLTQQPDTDVYLVSYDPAASPSSVSAVTNISRNPGYDNQPSFTPDGAAVLFTSNRDGRQTDIYRYEIASGTLGQLTRTDESEYSPLVTPAGSSFSAVRVEADGTQRLWQFDLDGGNPRVVLETVKPVGYHVWIDPTHLGLFVLGARGEPATLQIADTAAQSADIVASNIGRSLLMRPGTATLSFVSRPAGGPSVVMSFDPATRTIVPIVDALDGSQDCAWDPRTGRLLMARGSVVYGWTPGQRGWTPVVDLASAGVTSITRLAVGPDAGSGPLHLAFVAEPLDR